MTTAIFAALAMLRAQQLTPEAAPTATLIPASRTYYQCEPIRCTLRVAGNGTATVRSYWTMGKDPWSPVEIERRQGDDDRWLPITTSTRQRPHPARYVITAPGQQVEPGQTFEYEVELWDLAVLSEPGTIRMRFVFKAAAKPAKDATWTEVATPWEQFEIRPHAGNAAQLVGEAAAADAAEFDRISTWLNTTMTATRSMGPWNPGPGGRSNRWERFEPLAKRLADDAKVSFRVRARARLVLAYSALDRALMTKDDARADALRAARAHLDAAELTASPPSGGLDALPSGGMLVVYKMLVACADGLEGIKDPRVAHRELCERYPFFAHWWREESAELLLK